MVIENKTQKSGPSGDPLDRMMTGLRNAVVKFGAPWSAVVGAAFIAYLMLYVRPLLEQLQHESETRDRFNQLVLERKLSDETVPAEAKFVVRFGDATPEVSVDPDTGDLSVRMYWPGSTESAVLKQVGIRYFTENGNRHTLWTMTGYTIDTDSMLTFSIRRGRIMLPGGAEARIQGAIQVNAPDGSNPLHYTRYYTRVQLP